MDARLDTQKALNLAGQVLRKEICLDEGLLVSNATGVLIPFIDSLNVLANGKFFDQAELEHRVHSGEARFAAEGRAPRLELPAELGGSGEPGQPQAMETGPLTNLSLQVTDLLNTQAESCRELTFLESMMTQRPTPPNPWMAAAIIMALALSLSGLFLVVSRSVPGALLSFVLCTMVAALVGYRDTSAYSAFMEKLHAEEERRTERKRAIEKTIADTAAKITLIRDEAVQMIQRYSEEDVQLAMITYPNLFPPAPPARNSGQPASS